MHVHVCCLCMFVYAGITMSSKTLLRHTLGRRSNKFKQMTNKVKFWGGNNTALEHALQKEKETKKLANKFATTKTEGKSVVYW